jgi:diguanylate cyclase (GGDEF)-like protein
MTSAVDDQGRDHLRSAATRLGSLTRLFGTGAKLFSETPLFSPYRLFVPLSILVAGAFVVAIAVGCTLARQADDRHVLRQHASLASAIDEFRTVFGDFVMRRASGIAALVDRGQAMSSADFEPRLVPTALSHYRHQRAYLVVGDGKVIASFPPGELTLPVPIVHAIETFHIEAATKLLNDNTAPATTDFVVIDDHPAIMAIATVPISNRTEAPLLVAVAPLDRRNLGAFERISGVDGLTVAATALPDHEMQSLLDERGRIVGWLSWEARRPMLLVVQQLAPFLAILAAFLIGFAFYGIHQARRANRELAESEAQARKLAHEDVVTGLGNRRKMLGILDAALAQRSGKDVVTLAFVDIDGFKEINDSLGLEGGDQLLAAVGRRLQETIPTAARVGRFGGDEFVIILTTVDIASGIAVADAAEQALARPFSLAGQMVQVGATIGVAQAPRHGDSRDDLMRRADLAMRTAKRTGRGHVVDFEPTMEDEYRDRRFINRELRIALAQGGLDVHYQMIVAADSQRVVGVEALLRWKHPIRGDIPPAMFVPVAEQSGLMGALGEFVLRRALSDATRWPKIFISVNLSPVQVRDRSLVSLVAEVMRETGIEPARVMLEVTEGLLIDNPDEAKTRLEELRAYGVKIALDDFGSGFSSLSYLRNFPIDKLKIDKEFVKPLGTSANGGVIIQAITALGRALGLTVLAEGVETEEQRILLRLAGCNEMQGYLFARPAPSAAIDRLLAAAEARPKPATPPKTGSIVET